MKACGTTNLRNTLFSFRQLIGKLPLSGGLGGTPRAGTDAKDAIVRHAVGGSGRKPTRIQEISSEVRHTVSTVGAWVVTLDMLARDHTARIYVILLAVGGKAIWGA
eukprot:6208040-Pleurochrysis_carterae.AAC.3